MAQVEIGFGINGIGKLFVSRNGVVDTTLSTISPILNQVIITFDEGDLLGLDALETDRLFDSYKTDDGTVVASGADARITNFVVTSDWDRQIIWCNFMPSVAAGQELVITLDSAAANVRSAVEASPLIQLFMGKIGWNQYVEVLADNKSNYVVAMSITPAAPITKWGVILNAAVTIIVAVVAYLGIHDIFTRDAQTKEKQKDLADETGTHITDILNRSDLTNPEKIQLINKYLDLIGGGTTDWTMIAVTVGLILVGAVAAYRVLEKTPQLPLIPYPVQLQGRSQEVR